MRVCLNNGRLGSCTEMVDMFCLHSHASLLLLQSHEMSGGALREVIPKISRYHGLLRITFFVAMGTSGCGHFQKKLEGG